MNAKVLILIVVVVALLLLPDIANAAVGGGGSGGTEFTTIYTTVKGWALGTLGRLIALSCFLVGLGIGVVRQSIMAFVIGVAMALCLAYGPTVLENIFTATLDAAPAHHVVAVRPLG